MKPSIDPIAVNRALALGGLVLFAGGKDPFKAGPGFLLTDLIDLMSHSQYSHSAIAMPAGENPPYIYESTISGKISGPQSSDLTARVEGYAQEGGHAWILPFLPLFAPNWNDVQSSALHMIAQREAGQLHYGVARLFADAAEMSWVFDVLTLPADGVVDYLAAHSKNIVCSEMAGLLCQAGGVNAKLMGAGIPWLPNVKPPNQPIGDTPADLAAMPMCVTPVQMA